MAAEAAGPVEKITTPRSCLMRSSCANTGVRTPDTPPARSSDPAKSSVAMKMSPSRRRVRSVTCRNSIREQDGPDPSVVEMIPDPLGDCGFSLMSRIGDHFDEKGRRDRHLLVFTGHSGLQISREAMRRGSSAARGSEEGPNRFGPGPSRRAAQAIRSTPRAPTAAVWPPEWRRPRWHRRRPD